MSVLLHKVLIKLFHKIGWPKFIRIKAGPLKNKLWSTKISDTSYGTGRYETEAVELIKSNVSDGDYLFDIGANAGYFSMIMGMLAPHGNVYAFEPIPGTFSLLTTHIERNGYQNVRPFQVGISDEPGILEFSNNQNISANTYVNSSGVFTASDKVKVETTSLDNFIGHHKIERADFIKIDVEGAEYDVLKGAEKTLKKFKPVVLLATHDCHIKGIRDKCVALMEGLNYRVLPTGESKKLTGQEDFICYPA